MTAKERATEIYNKFRNELPTLSANVRAKKCAITHVKGIIDCLDRLDFSLEIDYEVKYWQQVLNELNQM